MSINDGVEPVGSLDEVHELLRVRRNCLVQAGSGWENLGGGSFRFAYRSPSGVVYKIAHDNLYHQMQRREVMLFQYLRDKFWTMPAYLWEINDTLAEEVIVAMPYVMPRHPGASLSVQGERDLDQARHWFDDLHGDNISIGAFGRLIVIDGGNVNARYSKLGKPGYTIEELLPPEELPAHESVKV